MSIEDLFVIPAFPHVKHENWQEVQRGMSLLDWFAGQATERDVEEMMNISTEYIDRATARYMHAEAMLRERERRMKQD